LPQNKQKKRKSMDSVFKLVNGFVSNLVGVFMGLIPLTILWFVLTGTSVLGFDVVANMTSLLSSLANGGFIGLVVLVLLCSFFTKK
jgi:Na+/H+-dicarboxylate symporter